MENNAKALKRIISKFETEWQGEAELAIKRLYELMDGGLKTEAAVRKLRQEFPQIFQLQGIQNALVEAAAYGYGVMPSVLVDVEKAAIINVVSQPWSADGMKLSEKLHAYDSKLHQTIVDTVQEQVRKNATAIQISRQLYDGYKNGNDRLERGRFTEDERLPKYINKIKSLQNATIEDSRAIRQAATNIDKLARNGAPNTALKAAYSKLLTAVEGNNDKAIKNAINVAVNEKSRYIADRIARTEMARAYADGFFSKHQNNKNVVGYEYELSTRHPVFDVCDMYAKADMFNLGKGIYPKDKLPLIPVHPHCLCTYSVVFKGQVDLSKQQEQKHEAIAKWLGGLTEQQGVQVMGRAGYAVFKAADAASNKRNSRTGTNISPAKNKYSYEAHIRNFNGLGHPQYREIKIFGASGAFDGALNNKHDPTGARREKHAEMYYQTIRKRGIEDFTNKVSKNTGFSKSFLESVYNHIFVNKYELETGYHSFDASYDMSQSLARLLGESGKIQQHDLIMLRHEHLELALMTKLNYNYSEAHVITNKKYNYSKALMDWIDKNHE